MKDHLHMHFAMILMTIVAIWPVKWKGLKLRFYTLYFYVEFAYFIVSDVILQGAMIFRRGSSFLETASNLGVTMVYIINIYRVIVCRSKAMYDMLFEIESKEKLIYQSSDEDVKRIYDSHVKSGFREALFYTCLGSSGITMYLLSPLVKTFVLEKPDETGHKMKYLVYPSWFPFDPDEKYMLAYCIQVYGAFLGYAYIVYIGAFFLTVMKYCIGQIRILRHFLGNVMRYSKEYGVKYGLSEKQAQEFFVRLCVIEHQKLMRFIKGFNQSIKTYVLLEFVTSSFQLSLVVYQLLQASVGVERLRVLLYLATLCMQLYLFYWNGQEIIFQSSQLAQSISENEWFDLDVKVQKTLQLVIMRSQKPIAISIGPFSEVKIDSLIAVSKINFEI